MGKLQEWRERLSGGEASVVKSEILATLEELSRPNQARAYGLLVACCRHLGRERDAMIYLARGEDLGARSRVARVELLAQGAVLWTQLGDAELAREYLEESLDLVERELAKPERSSHYSRRRRNWFFRAKARNLVVRGDLTHRLRDRPGREALRDALESIRIARGWLREQLCGVSLLCNVLSCHGSFDDVVATMRLADEIDRELKRRRFGPQHPYRLRIRWARAIALARLGMVDLAESMMADVARQFLELGLIAEAGTAAGTLIWIVGERAGKVGRANYLVRRFRESAPGIDLPVVSVVSDDPGVTLW